MAATVLRARWLQEIVPSNGPARILCAGALGTAVGDGAWYTLWAIYFTRILHLSPGRVGIALTVAGLAALLVITPIGHLGDLLGLRGTLVTALAVQAAAMACYLLVGSFWSLLAVAAVATSASQSASGVRDALTSSIPTSQDRFSLLAQERSAHQLGFAVGAALGALVLVVGTRPAFLAVIVLDSVTSFLYAGWLLRLPRLPVLARGRSAFQLTVIKDVPYIVVVGLTAALALCWGLLSTGIPLWITHHTRLPIALAAIIIVGNTLGVAFFQVRASRNSQRPRHAARMAAASGVTLALACLLLAATDHGHGWVATLLLLAGGAAELVGELWFVAALWGLSVGLRPGDGAAGQYQGMATTGIALATMLSPALMVGLVVTWGLPGWFCLAVLFAAVGGLTVPATAWALRRRPGPEEAAPAEVALSAG
jgi:MFS family permease